MFQQFFRRAAAVTVITTMVLGLTNVAWAAPPPIRSGVSSSSVATPPQHSPSQKLNADAQVRTVVPNADQVQVQPGAQNGFSEEERAKMKARQEQDQKLKQYKGGEVIIIGSTVLLVALVVVLVVVLVD